MKHLTITLALGTLLLVLCSSCSFMDKMYAAQKIDDVATPIHYTTLENYFVRNDVDCSKQQRLIIDNKQDFEGYFGTAATMGGLPTEINWKKQYVVAIILPETKRATSVKPVNVKVTDNDCMVFSYHVKKGDKMSHSMVPFTAVAIDKPASTREMQIFYLEK
ncbi:MAG: hypothetical protein IJK41_03415 [Muribaculaceae bacterium]|nr:hypothetical protein [Muribaculaceae bacterium]